MRLFLRFYSSFKFKVKPDPFKVSSHNLLKRTVAASTY